MIENSIFVFKSQKMSEDFKWILAASTCNQGHLHVMHELEKHMQLDLRT